MHRLTHARAFTLVELMIVIMILALLALLVVPKFTQASDDARSATLRDELRIVRLNIQVYKSQHNDVSPGFPNGNFAAAATEQAFVDQLTSFTNAAGDVSTTRSNAHPFGKYLLSIPVNQVNGKQSVLIVDGLDTPTPDGSTGWIYQPVSGKFFANIPVERVDSDGNSFFSY